MFHRGFFFAATGSVAPRLHVLANGHRSRNRLVRLSGVWLSGFRVAARQRALVLTAGKRCPIVERIVNSLAVNDRKNEFFDSRPLALSRIVIGGSRRQSGSANGKKRMERDAGTIRWCLSFSRSSFSCSSAAGVVEERLKAAHQRFGRPSLTAGEPVGDSQRALAEQTSCRLVVDRVSR